MEEWTMECKFDEESLEKLKALCGIPEEIEHKMIDIYNYMAKEKAGKMVLEFDDGIKMICEIDAPKINLDDVLKGDEE